jgi:glycosyltransferase involved in cell wall biosynthesis
VASPDAPLKVVHLITGLARGGAETMLYRLLTRLDRQRFASVVVSLTDRGALGAAIAALGVPVYALGLRRGAPDPRAVGRLWRLLRRERPAVLQTWLYHADLLGLVAGRLAGVPAIVWNVRCSEIDLRHYSPLTALARRLLALLSGMPAAVVVNSLAGRRVHERLGYRPRRWRVIPNGFDLEQFRPDPAAPARLRQLLGVAPEAPLIGLVARYDPMKDHATFLQAARRLLDMRADARFVLVGAGVDWHNPRLAAPARALGLVPHLHLLGERDDVAALLPGLDLATLSSVSEAFPNVVGEAMACGVPCVVTDVGDAAYLVGDTGRVVPPRDPAALAAAWAELLARPAAARRALGRAARERVATLFSLEAVAKQYAALYAELAQAAAPEGG